MDTIYFRTTRHCALGPRPRHSARPAVSSGMKAPNWYAPVPRGLEIKIGEKLAQLRQLNEAVEQQRKP